jgi:hypothetical protein
MSPRYRLIMCPWTVTPCPLVRPVGVVTSRRGDIHEANVYTLARRSYTWPNPTHFREQVSSKSISSRVPKASPKGIWDAPDTKTISAAFPKVRFCPARHDTVFGAPSPSPSQRGRTGDAGHTEKRGGEWQGRLVSGTINFNLAVAYLATKVIGAQRRCSARRVAATRPVAPSSACRR